MPIKDPEPPEPTDGEYSPELTDKDKRWLQDLLKFRRKHTERNMKLQKERQEKRERRKV